MGGSTSHGNVYRHHVVKYPIEQSTEVSRIIGDLALRGMVAVLMMVALGIRTFAIISLVNSVRLIREIAIMDAVNNRQLFIANPDRKTFRALIPWLQSGMNLVETLARPGFCPARYHHRVRFFRLVVSQLCKMDIYFGAIKNTIRKIMRPFLDGNLTLAAKS